MQKNLTVGIIGLMIGLIIGFTYANKSNRAADTAAGTAAVQSAGPFQGQQVDSVAVKDQSNQGTMMPEVAALLKKAADEPGNFEAQVAAGDSFLKIRNFTKALEYYEAANRIKPGSQELTITIGNTYFDAGEMEKAEGWYVRALEKDPKNVDVRTDLGITFVERGTPDLDRAIKEFRTSLETKPNHEPTLYNLAVAFLQKGDRAGAQEVLGRLETANPQSELLVKLKQVLK